MIADVPVHPPGDGCSTFPQHGIRAATIGGQVKEKLIGWKQQVFL